MSDIRFAELVHAVDVGKLQAKEKLFVSLYDALRQMAKRELRRGFGASLTPTTLLHETYLNISQRESVAFRNRGQFRAYAARAMRGLIVGERTVQRDWNKARMLLRRFIANQEPALRAIS